MNLSLEHELLLARVMLEARDLDREQLLMALHSAWIGWLLEREATREAVQEAMGVELLACSRGFTPLSACGVEKSRELEPGEDV